MINNGNPIVKIPGSIISFNEALVDISTHLSYSGLPIPSIFTEDNIVAKRSGGKGVSPIYFKDILKKNASKNYNVDDIIDE